MKIVQGAYRAMRVVRQIGNETKAHPLSPSGERGVIVMTIASRRREASIEYVQRTVGAGETRKIHSVTQRLGAVKEDEAMNMGGIQVPMHSPSM